MLKGYADFLGKDKNEIADHLGALTKNKNGDRQAFRALLFYLLASPVFKASELEKAWIEKLQIAGTIEELADMLSMDRYTEICEITLDFHALQTQVHDFGKIVCFASIDFSFGIEPMDENNQPLKHIPLWLFITRTLKIKGKSFAGQSFGLGERTLQYLELDL
ncbi:hypothetical protein NHP190012_13780 [Helicobacter sp. NHP19-012]|uniref:Uncharacterized protein n=1 Tax=Helicobacter gastrofelis TaxID=2849642 RepID=A0ABM7SFT0_9HELI|nr:hypothetical protein [Helicobacter sp. NHP19-012]BCZ19736.1 hypothetical protein NHP190012_13780 [Helicobacter sp. NHP19-012]